MSDGPVLPKVCLTGKSFDQRFSEGAVAPRFVFLRELLTGRSRVYDRTIFRRGKIADDSTAQAGPCAAATQPPFPVASYACRRKSVPRANPVPPGKIARLRERALPLMSRVPFKIGVAPLSQSVIVIPGADGVGGSNLSVCAARKVRVERKGA